MALVLIKALSLVAVVAIGYGFKRLGWLRQEHFSVLAIIVLRITLPAALITSFNSITITGTMAWLILIGLAVNVIQQLFTWVIARHRTPERRSFATLHAGSYNIGAFAMPYVSQLVGGSGVVYTAMFDIGNSLAVGGIGYSWGLALVSKKKTTWQRFLLTMVRSPVFDVYLVLLVLRLARLSFPSPVITFTSLVGQANPFCAMLMIGLGLELRLPKHKWLRAATYLLRRYIFVIVFSLAIWFGLPGSVFSHEIKVVLMMVLWAPVAAMVSGFVDETKGDVQLSSLITSISVVVAIVMMPVVYLLANGG